MNVTPENDEHSGQIVTHRPIELEKFEKFEVVSFHNFFSLFFTILGPFFTQYTTVH